MNSNIIRTRLAAGPLHLVPAPSGLLPLLLVVVVVVDGVSRRVVVVVVRRVVRRVRDVRRSVV